MDENNWININYSYTDEFGQISNLHKTFKPCVLEDKDTIDVLVDEFKNFLIGAGFLQNTVDKIQFKND